MSKKNEWSDQKDCSRDDRDRETGVSEKELCELVASVAEMSLQTERDRDASLKGVAEQLLVCITILSVAYLTPIQVLLELHKECGIHWIRIVFLVYFMLLFPLLVALVLTLLSLVLRKAQLLKSPVSQYDHFSNAWRKARDEKNPITALDVLDVYCSALDGQFEAFNRKHCSMHWVLRISMVLVIISVVFAGIGMLVLLISIL